MIVKIPVISEHDVFDVRLFIKSSDYKILLDTGAFFAMSNIVPKKSYGEKNIKYQLCGDKASGTMALWDVNLLDENDIAVPTYFIGMYIDNIPKLEEGSWDFLAGNMFLRDKKLHLDFDFMGALKEGWIEFDDGK